MYLQCNKPLRDVLELNSTLAQVWALGPKAAGHDLCLWGSRAKLSGQCTSMVKVLSCGF